MKSKTGDLATRLQIEERRLIEALPLTGGIFLPTEAVPIAERVAGLKRVRAIYEWRRHAGIGLWTHGRRNHRLPDGAAAGRGRRHPRSGGRVMKVKRRAKALTNRARPALVACLDGHHPDAAGWLRAAPRRLRSSPM